MTREGNERRPGRSINLPCRTTNGSCDSITCISNCVAAEQYARSGRYKQTRPRCTSRTGDRSKVTPEGRSRLPQHAVSALTTLAAVAIVCVPLQKVLSSESLAAEHWSLGRHSGLHSLLTVNFTRARGYVNIKQ
ncbi:hypothetical protein EVAR_82398_1 [Eumeta japonica]|uniref:Uncharacterized protein n=1 Tax=Eumeta variegata TaxID=151549 RepID=A0A4C1U9W1_EUMVA|nr:hypothetical protein EVAR_82398_1 [Eumeta japonica]